MNYYYDLTLCFKEKEMLKFYEWELNSDLIEIKKIPLYKVSEKSLYNFLKYDGFLDIAFIKKLKNRTVYKKNGQIKTISYAAIFTDSKFSIALELDNKGNIIKRSYLMLEDELNTIEIGYSLKKEKIIFTKLKPRIINNVFKQEEKMKSYIKDEINRLYSKKDFNQLGYYYMEWFQEYNNDINIIYNKMIKELENTQPNRLDLIYNLVINLSI